VPVSGNSAAIVSNTFFAIILQWIKYINLDVSVNYNKHLHKYYTLKTASNGPHLIDLTI